jgi:uncharacterized caspase-like protein
VAANTADHALVIGIRRYADAADPSAWIGNLNGPDNDAAAVADWLQDPTGGDLPPANVRVIRSADLPDPFPDENSVGPQQSAVERALNDLAELSPSAYQGQYAGRRLYVYASGHGFARANDEAALVTAEATRARPLNVLVTSWLEWLWVAGRFQEYVLWVDSCATRQPLTFLKGCDRNPEISANSSTTRRFIVFAAGFDKLAVEAQIEGEWHGIFTYALLKALRGAAPRDQAGSLTSLDVSNYMRNNMSSFMTDEQKADARVAREPAFAKADPITFAAASQPLTFPVTLRFAPAAVGQHATVSTDAGSPLVAETTLQQTDWPLKLEAGAYVAFVPALNSFRAFAVSGGETDQIVTVQ